MSGPILIFGAEGQIGWELQHSLGLLGKVLPLARSQVDIAKAAAVRAAITLAAPSAIVNAAAYTAVDKAESDGGLAHAVNAEAPAVMAEEARNAGVPLIHYSTDYVYAGDKNGCYIESDAPDPRSAYGRSKLAGDQAIMASGCSYLILRTSWVFSSRGMNFLKTILRLAKERDTLRVVADQVGAPTSAELLADVSAHVLRSVLSGASLKELYHCTATGETSWHGYACFIVSEAKKLGMELRLSADAIEAIGTEEYPTPAKRPANSRLDCSALERDFGLQLPDWQMHVSRTLRELITP